MTLQMTEAEFLELLPYLSPEELTIFDTLTADISITVDEATDYTRYQADPAGFGTDILGEMYTADVIRVMESVRDNPVTIAESANATGKSQPVNTPVLTPGGFVPIGSLRPGDCVIGSNGAPTAVVGVFPQGLQPTYKISFNDGAFTHCSQDHLWAVRSSSAKYRGRPYDVMTTEKLTGVLHRFMHIPMCQPVQFPAKAQLIDPYVMGVLLGDGTMGQYVRFDSEDQFIVEEVRQRVGTAVQVKLYRKTHYGITSPPGKPNPILAACQQYGLIGKSADDKSIPHDYLYGSVEQRTALLQGLMDTDGTIDTRHSFSFTSISLQLARDVQELIWSLGGTAKMNSRRTSYTHNGRKQQGKTSYRLHIKLPFCPFLLPRKRARYVPEGNLQKQAHRLVASIERVEDQESVCIQVAASDGLYLTENYIVTHNTHGAARIAVWWYKSHKGAQVYTAAAPPLENLEKLLWGEIYSLTSKHPAVFQKDRIRGDLNITNPKDPLSFITGVAIPNAGTPAQREAKFSGKHAPYLLFILDEADAIPPEVYRGIESCLSGGRGRLLCMYNPRSNEGPIAGFKERGVPVVKLSAFNHPNVITGRDIIPGAVTRNKTIHRIQKWTVPATADYEGVQGIGRFTVPDFLVGKVANNEETAEPFDPLPAGERIIIEPEFSYMVMGEYPGQSVGVIYDTWLNLWDSYRATLKREDDVLLRMIEDRPADPTGAALAEVKEGLTAVGGWADGGNVSPLFDYEPGAGPVLWAMDDGYAGVLDPNTKSFTADSHPRVIGFYQIRPNGDVVLFDEISKIQEPKPERQIAEAAARGYPVPEYVCLGPGSSTLAGLLAEMGYYKRECHESVEETIKLMRNWISADDKGHRRFKVHPRCKLFIYEATRYKRDDRGRIIKAFDHSLDQARYLCHVGRNGFY